MKNYIKNFALFLLIVTLVSCSKDDEDQGSDAAVDQITLSMQHIVTPLENQPASRSMKYNMLNDKMYFQELTGNPWTENARLWEYNVNTNQYTLKNARGKSFSWSGWGMKLYNLPSTMVHLDYTGEPDAEFYVTGGDDDFWAEYNLDVPSHIFAGDVAVSGTTAYFTGGNFSNSFTSLAGDRQWYDLAPLPFNIEDPVLVADDNYVYSIGGNEEENGPSEQNYFARYSIQNNQWEQLADLPNRSRGSNEGNKALIIRNRFLVVVSSNDSNGLLLDIYDLQENVRKTEGLSLSLPSAYIYQYNDILYIISPTYNAQTELVTCSLYTATLENLPN